MRRFNSGPRLQNLPPLLLIDYLPPYFYNDSMGHPEIRRKFVEFFTSRGHLEIPAASLVPEYDPTLLLTNSGMAPLKPYFLGQGDPPSRRLVNLQRCLRTNDIESVGDIHHLTFFEMMGNWSIGDPKAADGIGEKAYFKREAIEFAWDLLEEFGLDRRRVSVGVFGGDPAWKGVPPDEESRAAWLKVGVPDSRILSLPSKDSFWFSGPTGPCGPNTDVLYDLGQEFSCGKSWCGPTCDCGRFLEIWNAGVFMTYSRKDGGEFGNLPGKSVDAGAGLERFALVLQGVKSVYETDLFADIINCIRSLSEVREDSLNERSVRIIADHLRAATFLSGDGVEPSNTERGYVLRRLIRRAILHGLLLGIDGYFTREIVGEVAECYSEVYPHLIQVRSEILRVIEGEERNFGDVLKRGVREYQRLVKSPEVSGQTIPGHFAFRLYDSLGFPYELTEELARQSNLVVNRSEFEVLLGEQKERSRRARSETVYDPSKIRAAHTAAHLFNAALKKVLGREVHQMGQKISEGGFHHDFNLDRKLTPSEIREIEAVVRTKILEDLPVVAEETTFEKAKSSGAEALFEEKYRLVDRVTLYRIGEFSRELCGGPHVASTGEIKGFKILKEESASSGVRRVKAVVG